ncbi:type III secretion system export apparatus subunit SctT [Paludibacterium sp. THUN1379]|uniref:type III secretion system export apparatus subunit SctT n=1 Tax=Paludibacterium sp. THUN1379 TaxID=3112107 RepID=UPI00308B4D67|nr:type III secretion system export apparatus subunit SctT [Paludibacterium sp. THUN1379]
MPPLTALVALTLLAAMRPLGAMLLVPLFAPGMLGGSLIRNTLALMAAFMSLPFFWDVSLPDPGTQPLAYALLLAGELTIGLLLGFAAALPFWALDMAGFVLDTMRGASMASVLNPLLGSQSSALGFLFAQLLATVFLVSGGFHALINALLDSYRQLPPGGHWQFGPGFLRLLDTSWQMMYALALRFAMPGVVIMVLIDLGLGLINRTVQQLNVFSLSMPIKSLAVLLMLLLALQYGLQQVDDRFVHFDAPLLQGLLTSP